MVLVGVPGAFGQLHVHVPVQKSSNTVVSDIDIVSWIVRVDNFAADVVVPSIFISDNVGLSVAVMFKDDAVRDTFAVSEVITDTPIDLNVAALLTQLESANP